MELHENQLKLLKYLKGLDTLEGKSLWQIARETGLKNAQTVSHHLKQLEKYGYLRRNLNNPANFEILKDPIEDVVYINQYGFAQCGNQSEFLSEGNLIGRLAISTKTLGLANPNQIFGISAKGDSMSPIINNKDLVLFNRQDDTDNPGDIALVIDDGCPKIKKVYKNNNEIILNSINPNPPYNKDKSIKNKIDFKILGIAKGIIRGL